MKYFVIVSCLLLLCFAMPCFAQTSQPPAYSEIVGIGANWNQYASPQINPTFFWAHKVLEGTYSFNLVDVTFVRGADSAGKLQTMTSMTPGIAQHMRDIGPVKIYGVATVGVATGVKTGLAWSSGLASYWGLGKGWGVMGIYRALSVPDPVINQNVIQGAFGLSITWGK